MQRTTSMAFVEATVYDSRDQACAHATGTFKYVKRDTSKGHKAGISTD
jgi:acyl-coenzyme A thioesterase PaaI-like protein